MSNNTENLSVTDFEKVCRTCLGRGKMKNLYEKCCKDNCLIEMLLSVTFLQLSEKDGLPFQICLNCEEEITRAYKFAVKCSEVDMKLRNCITEFENKTNKELYTAETVKIENLDTENVEMQIKTEIENAHYTISNIIPEELFQYESEKQDEKFIQSEDKNIDNRRINENEHNYSEMYIKYSQYEDGHFFQDESGEPEGDRIDENLPQNKNNVIDGKINGLNGISKPGKQTKRGKKSKIKDEIIVQDDTGETESDRIDENLPQNNSVIDKKTNNEKGVSKLGKETKRIIKQKIEKLIVDQTFQCKKCYEKFPTSKLLWMHYKAVQHPSDTRIICEICSESVLWKRMTDHMRVHNKEKPYCCKICSKHFSVSCNLSRHMNIHTGVKPHKCKYCNKSFNQSSTLKTHERIHTGERPYKCEYCDKSFIQSASIRSHLRIHTDERLYMSENCEKGFGSGTNLKIQLRKHEPQHECNVCHRKYKTNPILKTHMLLHDEKQILCSECGKRFLNKSALGIHSRVHTGIKQYSCDVCGKKFRLSSSLKKHKLIHTGEKPHICKICNRGFTQAPHLKQHLRTHTGEKPFSCKYCTKSFALSINLKVHTRTHTGETPYLCPVCGKGFYDSSSMKKHKQGHEKQ